MTEEAPLCEHFQRAAELIGKRWNPQVVRALQTGSARFGDLKHAVPNISDAVLSERLKELEAEGIVPPPALVEAAVGRRPADRTVPEVTR